MIKILQFGEGNFLRAFAEDYIEQANEKGLYDGGVAICQPRKNTAVIDALKSQGGRYSVLKRGRLDGEVIDEAVQINCIERCIDSAGEYEILKETFCLPSLETVISNTTEAGICFDESDVAQAYPDITFPAKITLLLSERYKKGGSGLVFLPCELIENNGAELKKCVKKYARLWRLGGGFENYIENDCSFCSTLVDRIVTGKTEYGGDCCAVACEPYASWLIEADERAKKIIPFAALDGVEFVSSIAPYRERKVKILNGVHTMSVLAAYNAGFEIVRDMVCDPVFSAYIKKGLREEILPTIDLERAELEAFAGSVLERFNNPFIDHKLLGISLNSVSKFKARCLCTYLDYADKFGTAPNALSFALAALINFYELPSEKPYPIKDSDSAIKFFNSPHGDIVLDVMKNTDFWDADLTQITGAYDCVKRHYDRIKKHGVKAAVEILIGDNANE